MDALWRVAGGPELVSGASRTNWRQSEGPNGASGRRDEWRVRLRADNCHQWAPAGAWRPGQERSAGRRLSEVSLWGELAVSSLALVVQHFGREFDRPGG